MSLEVDVQVALEWPELPTEAQLQQWAQSALSDATQADTELTIRIVDEAESSALNQSYRHKSGATNVLSFPFDATIAEVSNTTLGDVVICAPVVAREALSQDKTVFAHWAHMVVHGVLHLRGYDHSEELEASRMEVLETQILAELGYPNPYGDSYHT